MASVRINIVKTDSVKPQYGIDRTMPAMLPMGEDEWKLFCERVDRIICPLNLSKFDTLLLSLIICFLLSSPAIAMFIILRPLLLVIFIPLTLMICRCSWIHHSETKKRSVYQLRQLCEETSRAANDEISFHFRDGVIQGSEPTDTSAPCFIEARIRTIDVIVVVASDATTTHAFDSKTGKQFPDVEYAVTDLPFAQAIKVDEEETPARQRQADDQKDVEKDMESASSLTRQ
ncbi:hypothetical protein IV203_015899 [Nitzschia inconspicua]|uniref:Uncharacterized protein n=1 Tax=Nitzschia inconspicua TaxID=303405 RepID=A0A9K3LCM6_9STRA|nr:hypothetical protein IV203_015899 [Nitzschia inconspicua]